MCAWCVCALCGRWWCGAVYEYRAWRCGERGKSTTIARVEDAVAEPFVGSARDKRGSGSRERGGGAGNGRCSEL